MKQALLLSSFLCLSIAALAQPSVGSITPSSAYPGATVTISGSGFDATAANNVVMFGSVRAVVLSASATTLAVTAPAGAMCAPVSVLNTTMALTASQQPFFTPTFDASSYMPWLLTMNPKVDITAGTSLISTIVCDIDGDGKPDIVTSNTGANTISVFRNISATGTLTSGSFDAAVTFATNTNPGYFRVADVNNDGKPDVVTSNANGTISILRNTATPGSITSASFATKVDYTLSSNCYDVAIADFNNDGKPDLAVVNFVANTVSVLRNNSSGATLSFSVAATLSTAAQPGRLAAADFDGDGKIDIAVANNNGTGGVSVFRNKDTSGTIATATFATKVDFTTGTYLTGITCADYDGDGKTDIAVVSNNDNALSIFRNTSTSGVINSSSFASRVNFGVGGNPQDVVNGDLNGDGKPDLVVANSTSANVVVWLNKAESGTLTTASFGSNTFFTTGNGPRGLAVCDLDGDNIPDIVTANTTASTISILKNTPSAVPPVISSITPATAQPGATITFTGANFSSIPANNVIYFGGAKATVTSASVTTLTATLPAYSTAGQVTLLNTATGKFSTTLPLFTPTYDASALLAGAVNLAPKVDFTAGSAMVGTATGDIDGDGKPDIIAASAGTNNLYIYRNTSVTGSIGSSSFSSAITLSLPTSPYYCRLADIDADGKLDILTASTTGYISIYRNQSTSGSISTASFTARQDIAVGTPMDVAVADFNRDGKPDIVVANYASNSITILKNTSSGSALTFASSATIAVPFQPSRMFAGDLDGDGKADIAVSNNGGTNVVSVYRNIDTANLISAASFATRVDFSSGAAYPFGLVVADFDKDGKPDIAMANNNGDNVSVFKNLSTPGSITTGSFSSPISYAAGSRANNLDVADMNGDSYADIIVTNYNSSTISVLLNSGTSGTLTATSFINRTDFATGAGPNGISVGDLDGDGKPDVVTANQTSGTISILRNNPVVPPTISSVSSYNTVAGSTITITGNNFNATAANNVVYFGGAKGLVTSGSTTTLAVTTPTGALFGPIVVTDSANSGLSAFSQMAFYPSFNNVPYLPEVLNFSAKSDISINQPVGVTLADIDGDGKLDMLVSNNSAAISVYRNISVTGTVNSGSFANAVDIATGSVPYFIKVADIDGDGKPDLITNNRGSNSVSVLRNIGATGAITTGSFAAKVDYTMNSSINDLAIADFDGDGKPDIAAIVTSGPAVMIRRNTSYPGTIIFSTATSFTPGLTPSKIAAVDIDKDGKTDIITTNYGAATISILRNTATPGNINSTSFDARVDFSTGTNPYGLAVADVDNDGLQDIMVGNYGSGTLSLLKNTATPGIINSASLAARVDFTTGTNPYDITVADFDGDSRPDIAVANYNSSTLSVFRNKAVAGTINTATLAAKADFATGAGPYGIASGDIDGDGKPDLATANYGAYTVSVMRNTPLLYPPVVSAINPSVAVPGTTITISGSNFNAVAAKNIVYFGSVKATVTAGSATTLAVTAPAGSTTLPVSVLDSVTSLSAYAPNPLQASYDNTPYIPGTVNMVAQTTLTGIGNSRATYLSDIDGDGKPDIVIANTSGYQVSVYRNISATGSISSSSFATVASYTVSTLPYYIYIADIDGDGKPDVVSSNRNAGTVSVLRNTSTPGTISFAARVDFATGTTPYGVAVADIDQDGLLDIVVANYGSATVSVLKNRSLRGSISFYSQQTFTVGNNPMEVIASDLDGDGKTDIAITNYGSATVSVLRNTATLGFINSSSFAAKVDFTTSTNPQGIIAADIDYDGKPELAVTNYTSSTLSLFRNTTTSGSISSSSFADKVDFSTGTNPTAISVADVDGDAKQDILVTNYTSNTISIFRNTTTGAGITTSALAAKTDFATGANPVGIASGDLNNDNIPDVVVTNYGASTLSVFQNMPFFKPPVITSVSPNTGITGDAITISGANFNPVAARNKVFFGATMATVTAASATTLSVTAPGGATFAPVTVFDTTGGGSAYAQYAYKPVFDNSAFVPGVINLSNKVDFATGTTPAGTAFGDMDGDGKPDMVVTNSTSNTILFYRNTSAGTTLTTSTFATPVSLSTHTAASMLKIADVTADGRLDVIIANYNSNTVSVFRNLSTSGTITLTRSDYAVGTNPYDVAIADFDADGRPDIAAANYGGASISVLKNTTFNNAISFATAVNFTTGTNPFKLFAGDLDGDGKPDLAVTNYGSNTLSLFRNTASTNIINSSSFAAKVDITGGTNPFGLAGGDIDGDGKTDLVATNYGSSSMSVFKNTATSGAITAGSFAAKVDFTVGTNPKNVALADLNGDGNLDAVVGNFGTNNTSVLRHTGLTGAINTGTYATRINYTTGNGPNDIAVGDINADGYPDVAITNGNSATVSILRNSPLAPIAGPASACVGGTTISLTNTTSGGTWSSSATAIASVNSATGVINAIGAGTAVITYTVNGGYDTALFTINPLPVVTVSASATTLCGSSNITLTGAGAATYTWSSSVTPALGSGSSISATPSVTTTYSVAGTSAFGCVATASKSVAVYPAVSAAITSVPSFCIGHPVNIIISGTAGDTVRWSVDGGSLTRSVLAGGAVSISSGTGAHTYLVHDVRNANCSKSIDTTISIAPQTITWNGASSNSWSAAANWNCGFVPVVTDSILVPAGSAFSPTVDAVVYTKQLFIDSGAAINIQDGAILNVAGNIYNKGDVSGTGKLSLSGSNHQLISGNGSIATLELNNLAGAEINTGAKVVVVKTLWVTAGTLTTNDSLVLRSDMYGTARIAELPATGAIITGKVQAQQYIQANYRRYRFWSHPFSSAISLAQLQPYIDITGTGGAANGFTTTTTNASSAYRYDPRSANSSLSYDPGWKPYTRINGTEADSNKVNKYQGIRLFFRGAKGQGLDGNAYVPQSTVVSMTGVVNQGQQTVKMVKGTVSPSLQDINMLGNPYPSPVDIGTVLYNAKLTGKIAGSAFYVWNASLAFAGQYQAIEIDGSPYYLPAYACFQVRTAHNGDSLTFNESDKGSGSSAYLFKPAGDGVSLNIYDSAYHLCDMLSIKFDKKATYGNDDAYDAIKLAGGDIGFYSVAADSDKLAIDTRPFEKDKVIRLGVGSTYAGTFVIKAEHVSIPENTNIYLHDKLLDKYVQLLPGGEYAFAVTKDRNTQGDQRFELGFKPQVLGDRLKVNLSPNPANDKVEVSISSGNNDDAMVRVMDINGVCLYSQNLLLQSGKATITLATLPAGIYMVEVSKGGEKSVSKLIKE